MNEEKMKKFNRALSKVLLNPNLGRNSNVVELNDYTPKEEQGNWVYEFDLGNVFSQVSFYAVTKLYLGYVNHKYSLDKIAKAVRYYNYDTVIEYNNLLDQEKYLRKGINQLPKNHPALENLKVRYQKVSHSIEEFDHPILDWVIEENLSFLPGEIRKFRKRYFTESELVTDNPHLWEYYKVWCKISKVPPKGEYVGIDHESITAAQFFADVKF